MEPTTPEPEDALPPTTDLSGEAPTVAINTGLLPSMSQHCTRCGSELAPDQRYCVVCGERRGEPRLPFMDGRTPAQSTAVHETVTTTVPAEAHKSRWGGGATLLAGIGTLLLALGVGVLIGNAGKDDNSSAAAAAPQVITVNGAAASDTTAAASTTTPNASKDKSSKDSSSDKAKADKTATTPKTTTVVTDPTGEPVPAAAEPVVKTGQKGSGPGYKDGKFTGDFFGQ